MSRFTRPFMDKYPLKQHGINIKETSEGNAVKSFISNSFKKGDDKLKFSKTIGENKTWAKENPKTAAAYGAFTIAKWVLPYGKVFKAGKVGIGLAKESLKKLF